MVSQYFQHPAQFKYPLEEPLPVVTTFAGESCTFGQSSPAEGWLGEFTNKLKGEITFLPSFFVAPDQLGTTYSSAIDGYLAVRIPRTLLYIFEADVMHLFFCSGILGGQIL